MRTPGSRQEPVDLLLFAVKFGGLEGAVETCRHLVGPDTTVVISVLNGICQRGDPGRGLRPGEGGLVRGPEDVRQEGGESAVTYGPAGELALGVPGGSGRPAGSGGSRPFSTAIGFAYCLPADIRVHLWSKLLCNTGCNQAAMVFQCELRPPPPPRQGPGHHDRRHAGGGRAVANAEGVPSLRAGRGQSGWASSTPCRTTASPPCGRTARPHRKSEVELFAGTIRRLAKKHGIPVPVNDWLYDQVQQMEAAY